MVYIPGQYNRGMKKIILVLSCLYGAWCPSVGTAAAGSQDAEQIQTIVHDFLLDEAARFEGEAQVTVQMPQTEHLSACERMEPFLSNERALRSRTRVGVKCYAPRTWTTYVSANVKVIGHYPIANKVISAGSSIGPGDLSQEQGDLMALPADAAVTLDQILGAVAKRRLTPNRAIRLSGLRGANSITRGQQVHLKALGPGFSVQGEATALQDGEVGSLISVRTNNGQSVSGVVLDRQTVRIGF